MPTLKGGGFTKRMRREANTPLPTGLLRRIVPLMRGNGRPTTGVLLHHVPSWRLGLRPQALGPLGRMGNLEVRLARTVSEVKRAQALRYKIFYEEKSALPDPRTQATRRDADQFDALCDHMLVLDHDVSEYGGFSRRKRPKIVGTYRLLRQDIADRNEGFYSAGEFDLQPLLDRKPGLNILELGRSCVLKPYRTKRTVELLWHGVWSYVLMHKCDMMIGCASFEGTNTSDLAVPLSFLHHHCAAPEEWNVKALPDLATNMNVLAKEQVNMRAAMQAMPPLVKGYLRIGAYIGEGAVIDYQFNTTDVLILLPVSAISDRYIRYYGEDASRYAN